MCSMYTNVQRHTHTYVHAYFSHASIDLHVRRYLVKTSATLVVFSKEFYLPNLCMFKINYVSALNVYNSLPNNFVLFVQINHFWIP